MYSDKFKGTLVNLGDVTVVNETWGGVAYMGRLKMQAEF